MKLILVGIICLLFVSPAFADSLNLSDLINKYATKYNVATSTMTHIIDCESGASTTIQSFYHYTKDHPEWGVKKGDRELSFGLVQIHLPAHKDITLDQALDPYFSVNFLAQQLADGQGHIWACYTD